MMHVAPRPAAAIGGAQAVIEALLEARTGQQIAPARAWRLEAALKPVLRDLGIDSLDGLVLALAVARDAALSDRVVDALLNQETSFFRDPAMMEVAADAICAQRRASPGRRLRIWSAGCSTGQEPLSLAILLDERGIDPGAIDIVASDVSAGAVARARSGRYSQFEIQRGLSVHRMLAWFDAEGSAWTVRRELGERIRYRRQNLVEDAPPPGGFDLILCRNILLYLSAERRQEIYDRLAAALRPGGAIMLGASETVIGQTRAFVPHPEWRGLYCRA